MSCHAHAIIHADMLLMRPHRHTRILVPMLDVGTPNKQWC